MSDAGFAFQYAFPTAGPPPPPVRSRRWRSAAALALAGCGRFTETFQRGYVLQEGALEQIPIGATQEQVLIVMGTPSTVATVSGEAFYYISQKGEKGAAFMPQKVVDQRVIAVYFDKDRKVTRLANYGLKDGKVFDFISQDHADRRPGAQPARRHAHWRSIRSRSL